MQPDVPHSIKILPQENIEETQTVVDVDFEIEIEGTVTAEDLVDVDFDIEIDGTVVAQDPLANEGELCSTQRILDESDHSQDTIEGRIQQEELSVHLLASSIGDISTPYSDENRWGNVFLSNFYSVSFNKKVFQNS